jgi:hypothetical protein
MANFPTVSNDQTEGVADSIDGGRSVSATFAAADDQTERASEDTIRLDSCWQFETLVVRTRRSMYELIVLQGATGDVLVRGGRSFREFRRAVLAGSRASSSALKVNAIEVGSRMDFHVGHTIVITSRVTAVSRHHLTEPHMRTTTLGAPRVASKREENLQLRIRAEFGEMPGLKLTLDQACRLFNAEHMRCERTLLRLVRSGELSYHRNLFLKADSDVIH